VKESKNKGINKKKMKLKNIMNANCIQNNTKKVKQAKFGDIGMHLINNKRKKSYFNNSKHQNSEYIEIMNDISGIHNKGKMIV